MSEVRRKKAILALIFKTDRHNQQSKKNFLPPDFGLIALDSLIQTSGV